MELIFYDVPKKEEENGTVQAIFKFHSSTLFLHRQTPDILQSSELSKQATKQIATKGSKEVQEVFASCFISSILHLG